MERRLAAVLISDVVGYTKLMESDTEGTVSAWSDARDSVIKPLVESKNGRIVKFTGDGFLVEFGTVQAALECGIEMQNKLTENSLDFRMAINLGDIIDDGEDIHGEGINIAARLEGIADPGGICISGDVYNQVRNRITAEYEDLGPQEVKNVAEPVQAYAVRFKNFTSVSDKGGTKSRTEKPSIAVLPFDNMSGDPEQEYFSDGITEDIITDLSKLSGLLVIARNSSFTYKGQSPDIRKVAEELNVNHVLEGSIRKSGNRVRITAQLIEGSSGGHLWAERYDRDLTDIFEVQDEVTQEIVSALKVTLTKEDETGADASSTKDVEAHDNFLRGREIAFNVGRMDKDLFELSLEYFDRAIQIDPHYSGPYAGKAFLYVVDYQNQWSDNPDAALGRARKLVDFAIEKDDQDPFAYWVSSLVAVWEKDYQGWSEAADKALTINPNYAQALNSKATLFIYCGEPHKGIPFIEKALRLDPAFTQYIHFLGTAYFVAEEYEKASIEFKKRIAKDPKTDLSRAFLSSALGHLGHIDEARGIWEELMAINPNYSYVKHIERLPFKQQKDATKLAEGLRKAGLEN